MRVRPGCLLQSAGGEANRILLASALSSMCIICPNRVSRRDWIIAVSNYGIFLLLGGGICDITATSQFTRGSKQVPVCVRNIV